MLKKKVFYSIINSYFFDKKYSEDEIIKVCGMVNSAMHLVHPTCKISIRYERAKRKMSMVMAHTKNVAYENPVQYKDAMKLFDLAITTITKGVKCEVVEGAILPSF